MLEHNRFITLQKGKLQFNFLRNGTLYDAMYDESIMINQINGNPVDGSLNNLYLRIYQEDGTYQVYPLLGNESQSNWQKRENQLLWHGLVENIHYEVIFSLSSHNIWFWDIHLKGNGETVDVIYTQDLGLANQNAVQSNEAYVSQYIDHKVLFDENKGYVVCSRQNQSQNDGVFPYLQQGALTYSEGFSTDGFQFFGKSYKTTNRPKAFDQENLDNEVYQYEFAFTALKSKPVTLSNDQHFTFYGLFVENQPEAIQQLEYQAVLDEARIDIRFPNQWEPVNQLKFNKQFLSKNIVGHSLSKEDLQSLFPERKQEEWHDQQLLSFFTPSHEHVVLKEKENLSERPHGHILLSGNHLDPHEEVLASTSYMYGIFQSQVVIGNTSMHKLFTNPRNALNCLKTSGQRIYLEVDGNYQLLTMPSAYEMGFNYAKWYYKMPDDLLVVTVYTVSDRPEVRLEVHSQNQKEYRMVVTQQVVMNETEYKVPVSFVHDPQNGSITFHTLEGTLANEVYPHLHYFLTYNGENVKVSTDEIFFEGPETDHQSSLLSLAFDPTSDLALTIGGSLYEGNDQPSKQTFENAKADFQQHYKTLMRGFALSQNSKQTPELERMNTIFWWYTHDMLIHFLSPHGLEQYSGAAWGTRDVCQGPTEYFMAMQHYPVVRKIIETLFSHQFIQDGNWSQWFMFDRYSNIMAHESHGDIIVWPLKMVSEYLLATNDVTILSMELPYMDKETKELTPYKETLLEHLKKEVSYIQDHFLHDTYLSSYGDGDWDDTLQPANAKLKKQMASTWTVALTYQTIYQSYQALKQYDKNWANDLKVLAENIKNDFRRYFLKDSTLPGFISMENPSEVSYMLHPTDNKTNIQYRLLPMIQSISSDLLEKDEAEHHLQLIQQHLLFPDGVRLMNKPAAYHGGVSEVFKRAEQAANFGREIGLQYVHAHIRYVEALAKFGKENEAWEALQLINPILIQDYVSNAGIRQSNTYFSSSDGDFKSRYEAQEHFKDLKTKNVSVKGGWRVYSSGPGIYLHQFVRNMLGFRETSSHLVFDPVLPGELLQSGLTFQFSYHNYQIAVDFHKANSSDKRKILLNDHELTFEDEKNYYRQGGISLIKEKIDPLFQNHTNKFEIWL
ncbi:GH36-type glycosyl hydrolase domain-containing protein [Neobacillus sp.]|uniref:GH36-type glycosyl hydrolase domain-containing protein n=1 Tax=Neobacillus sp. TaxID=2675273 RepID=UPI0028A09FC3|nr:cellobiose phosphorylase [Neobacillus sp.]